MSGPTIAEFLRSVTDILATAGIKDARCDAQVLVGHVLERDRAYLHGFPETCLSRDQRDRLAVLVERRAKRVPMSQVLGIQEFWSLEFLVTDETLTPRPDSETLVEAAIAQFSETPGPRRIADLGTGNGCLLISLLTIWPESLGFAIDCSREALAVARRNAQVCDVAARAVFVPGNWLDGISERFELIVANPPYIPSNDLADLEPEVSDHEPHLALDGGDDGLEAYRAILPALGGHLAEMGVAVLEHGAGQGSDLEVLASDHGLKTVSRPRDLAGLRRCLVLRTD